MTLKELLNIYDNWNSRIRINDSAKVKPIVEFNHVHDFAFEDSPWHKKYSYLLNLEVIAFGFYDETLCVRVDDASISFDNEYNDPSDFPDFEENGVCLKNKNKIKHNKTSNVVVKYI